MSAPLSSSAEAARPTPWWRWALLAAYVLALVGLTLAARDPAWSSELNPEKLSQRGQALLALPLGPLAVLAGYVVLVLMAVPVLALIVVGATLFSPWPGMAYSLAGMVLGATVAFAFGRFTGAQGMDRLMRGRLDLLSKHLQRRGLLTVALVRFVPVAPFMVANLAAGALRVKLSDFVLGTALGLLPGTVVISLFTEQLVSAWQSAGGWASGWSHVWANAWAGVAPWQILLFAGGLLLAVTTLWWLRRRRAK